MNMQDQEKPKATAADVTIANQARTWRRAEKHAIGEKTDQAKKVQYHELQKLRQAVDTLGGR
jgi:hypothetical protein